jgi:nitrogen fixation-related uncharacterized protein
MNLITLFLGAGVIVFFVLLAALLTAAKNNKSNDEHGDSKEDFQESHRVVK